MSLSTISINIENCKKNPTLATIQKLKEDLFGAHEGNREPYTKGKEEFVRQILKLAGFQGKIL